MAQEAALTPKQREELKQIVESAVLGFRASIAKELRVLTDLVQDPLVQEYLLLPPEDPPAEPVPDTSQQADAAGSANVNPKRSNKPGSALGSKRDPRGPRKTGFGHNATGKGGQPRTSRNDHAPFDPEHRPQTTAHERPALKKPEEEKKTAPRWNFGGKKNDKRGKQGIGSSAQAATKESHKPITKSSTLTAKVPEDPLTASGAEQSLAAAPILALGQGQAQSDGVKEGAPATQPPGSGKANIVPVREAPKADGVVQNGESHLQNQRLDPTLPVSVAPSVTPTAAAADSIAATKGGMTEEHDNVHDGQVSGEMNAAVTSPAKDQADAQSPPPKEDKKSGKKGTGRPSSDKKKGGTQSKPPAFGPIHKR